MGVETEVETTPSSRGGVGEVARCVGAGKPGGGGVEEVKRVSGRARPAFVVEGGWFTMP